VPADPYEPLQSQLYDNCVALFRSSSTYSNSLEDLSSISNTINKVARIDRLPSANTYEAMHVLRIAWERVDVYTRVSLVCKRIAKLIYISAILLTIAVTVVTTLSLNRPDVLSHETLDRIIIALTLSGTVLISTMTFINPLTKWQQLRGAALALESEIWQFRTRSGNYSISSAPSAGTRGRYNRAPEIKLKQVTDEIASSALKSSTVMGTDFLSRFDFQLSDGELPRKQRNFRHYRHGQFNGAKADGTYGQASKITDDHHSPLTPALYLQLRVKPQLTFYQQRLPVYARARAVFEAVLVSASVAGSLLAFLQVSEWAVIASSVTAAVTAYQKFQNSEQKLTRFSGVIAGVDSLRLWWNALTDVEQAMPTNIASLVQTCEELFAGERQAWVTTAISTAMLQPKDEAAGARQHQ